MSSRRPSSDANNYNASVFNNTVRKLSFSDDDETPVVRSKKRIQQFTDSDGESEKETSQEHQSDSNNFKKSDKSNPNSDSESNDTNLFKSAPPKSRLRKMSSGDSSDTESNCTFSKSHSKEQDSCSKTPTKSCLHKMSSGDSSDTESNRTLSKSHSEEQGSRLKTKRNLLKQKFESLHKSATKEGQKEKSSGTKSTGKDELSEDSEASNYNDSSISKIKKIIKERTSVLKSTLYDPDTSDEESCVPKKEHPQKRKTKSTKLTSPKPVRMSAKQAMENMQKIKSESNRMLREKEVSLPYHRPKALSLKDIMSRRRPAVSADGKALPIKMNEEQLKQYVQQLEQRQKEVIELCKSESEEEEEGQEIENKDIISTAEAQKDASVTNDQDEADGSLNDTLYDNILNKNYTQLDTTDNLKTPEDVVNEVPSNNKILNEANSNTDNLSEDKEVETNIDEVKNIEVASKDNNSEQMQIDLSIREQSSIKDGNNSAEMSLVYNDSVEEVYNVNTVNSIESADNHNKAQKNTDVDSQLISLHYDTEKIYNEFENEDKVSTTETNDKVSHKNDGKPTNKDIHNIDFSDEDMDMNDIDDLIEKAEIIASQSTGKMDSPMLIKDIPLKANPKLTGAPGMMIDLDGTDPLLPKKLSGVELLKERYVYFAKLKTPEEMLREREKTVKPGTLHLKLKQELEEQIAEQRSLEWAKRLEDEKQLHKEMDAVMGEGSDVEEDIDKIEAKLDDKTDVIEDETSLESEEEDDLEQEIKEKPRKRNPMVDDEAEESDCDEVEDAEVQTENNLECNEKNGVDDDGNDADNDDDDSEEESSEESEESENDQQKPKKGRILKAFEDSDDEINPETEKLQIEETVKADTDGTETNNLKGAASQVLKNTQDDEIQLAQIENKSDDLFSQESQVKLTKENDMQMNKSDTFEDDNNLGTQTFSILESTFNKNNEVNLSIPLNLSTAIDSQNLDDNLEAAICLCSGSFSQSQNLITPTQTQSLVPPSQAIGDDVLALCTGQFYDNQFVSQTDGKSIGVTQDNINKDIDKKISLEDTIGVKSLDIKTKVLEKSEGNDKQIEDSVNHGAKQIDKQFNVENEKSHKTIEIQKPTKNIVEDANLKSILDELHDEEFDKPRVIKYFPEKETYDKEPDITNTQLKKKFIIDSDDEEGKEEDKKKKKEIKRKRLEKRALQISDDEDDEQSELEVEEDESEMENDADGAEKLIEYDDEENEIVAQPQNPKIKRKIAEFFENEAELTSEDEWIGSGDEDERGLDRMEREEGDDETFNQNQLQRELGQIHIRDVLDQDKREVRLIQELMFEDGDLGAGSRQRKFKWRDADGEEGAGIPFSDLPDTQEEEFESEEQWRKQRHEREMFLKSLKNPDEAEEALNISVNRTAIIKANLSKNPSSLTVDVNTSIEKSLAPEKKTVRDIPSPKKPFTLFQQNYHGSLLSRGRGALARLAALATPLANDDDTPNVASLKPTTKRSFVFAAIDTIEEEVPKVTKRKAENMGTPRLLKKMKIQEKQKYPKSSLLDHLKA